MLQMLDTLNATVTRALLAVAAAIIFCLGFLVCADIFGRALFNSPVKGTPEIVSMSIVIIRFLLAGYAVQSGSMIYTNVFTGLFGVRGDAFGRLLSALLGILFFGLIVWGSYEPTLHAWTSGEYEGEGALARAGMAGAYRGAARLGARGRELRAAGGARRLLAPDRAPDGAAPRLPRICNRSQRCSAIST